MGESSKCPKSRNFQTSNLKLAVCPLNIHNFKVKWSIDFRQTVPIKISIIQHFEADFLWKVSLKILNSGIILITFTHALTVYTKMTFSWKKVHNFQNSEFFKIQISNFEVHRTWVGNSINRFAGSVYGGLKIA